jgi:hypothetical protein
VENRTAEDRERLVMRVLLASGVIFVAFAPVVFILVVWNTMEPGDCIPGWGPCPTAEGVAIGVACAGVLLVVGCVLLGLALGKMDRPDEG